MKFGNHFGVILKAIRKDGNLTQDKLAELVDLDRTYISMLERGVRYPSLEVVMNICQALNIRCSEVIQLLEARCAQDEPLQRSTTNSVFDHHF